MSGKKKPSKRLSVPRPRNGGQWTEARYRQFVIGALRRAAWPPKYECIKRAYAGKQLNPATGRMVDVFFCAGCGGKFREGTKKIPDGVRADHVTPVVGPEGFTTYDDFIRRLHVEVDGFQALCGKCHGEKTAKENEERRLLTREENPH